MGSDKNIPIEYGSKSISNGMGYITIPIDRDREDYLRDFYRVGKCIMITNYNEVKKSISIPKHLINSIEFPNIPGDKGSLVHWMRIPGSSSLVVTGVHFTTESFGNSSEKKSVDSKDSISVIRDFEVNGYQISVKGDTGRPGEISLQVSNGESYSRFSVDGSGVVSVDGQSVNIESKEFTISLGESKRVIFDDDELSIYYEGHSIKFLEKTLVIDSDSLITLKNKESSINITDRGIIVETDGKVYLEGDKPVLYAKSPSSTAIKDLSEIGVGKKVRVS